jgi:hypothetical protein
MLFRIPVMSATSAGAPKLETGDPQVAHIRVAERQSVTRRFAPDSAGRASGPEA